MMKLLNVNVTCHMPRNMVSGAIMHVMLLIIKDAVMGAQFKVVGI
jgi:hypothetical protein